MNNLDKTIKVELQADITKVLYQNIVPYLIGKVSLSKGDKIPLGKGTTKEMFEDSPLVSANIMRWENGHYILNMDGHEATELIEQISHMEDL